MRLLCSKPLFTASAVFAVAFSQTASAAIFETTTPIAQLAIIDYAV
jgi:hypothetical protein